MQYRGADKQPHTHVLLYCILVYSCTCLKGLATVQKCDIVTHQFIHKYFCISVPMCAVFFFSFFFHPFLCKRVAFFSSCDQSANKLWGRVLSTHLCPNNILVLFDFFWFLRSVLTFKSQNMTRLVFEVAKKRKNCCWFLRLIFYSSSWSIRIFISHGPSRLNTMMSQKQKCFVFQTIWPLRSTAAESVCLFFFSVYSLSCLSLLICVIKSISNTRLGSSHQQL